MRLVRYSERGRISIKKGEKKRLGNNDYPPLGGKRNKSKQTFEREREEEKNYQSNLNKQESIMITEDKGV